MNSVIENMLSKYEIKNSTDETNAMKEIIQEIVLCGLSRGGFFDVAAFYGGTALRIFYGLNRFSEDLDFALLKPDKSFDLTKYFSYIEKEVKAYGFNLEIITKEKSKESNITSAFLKGDTKEHLLKFFPNENMQNITSLRDIKIKFEVDTNPPSGASYEFKYKLLPSPHQIRLYDEASLFAGKIHAVLCRGWNKRIKGRDLYDYVFYLSKGATVNKELLKQKLIESKIENIGDSFDINMIRKLLNEKFKQIDYKSAKEDVIPFIEDKKSIDIWNEEFFIEITRELH